jgi:type IX secretion system PorP/SprF family membrane protein
MKCLISILVGIICLVFCEEVFAQADIVMSTHWYNRAGYNPAFIARPDYLYLFSNYRRQWVGVKGAPVVLNVQASEYIHNLRSAFGVSMMVDNIGASRVLNPMISYAYKIQGKHNRSLSLGLSGGIFQRSVDASGFDPDNPNDPAVQYDQEKNIQPDANVGVEFQSAAFIFGLSSTHLFSIGNSDNSYLNSNHQYGYAIYKNNNSENFFYKLGILVIYRDNITVVEGNAFIRLKHSKGLMKGPREIFDFGISYRSSRQMIFLVGILLTPNLRLGYAYDHSFIKSYYASGTHELMLEYRIFTKAASTKYICGKRRVFGN